MNGILGEHVIILGRHTLPRLYTGRWYFRVLGKSILRDSTYTITADLQSHTEMMRQQTFSDSAEEVVYENERYNHNLHLYFLVAHSERTLFAHC